jgi:hypothetical protein
MTVADVKDLDFAHWKHHPITKVFLQFLTDNRKMLIDELLTSWEGGSLDLTMEKEIRGRSMLITEIVNLELGHIKSFYGVVDDAAETDTD